jgi:hypothetical protein
MRVCAVLTLTKQKQEYSSAVHNVCCGKRLKGMSRETRQSKSLQLCHYYPGENMRTPSTPKQKPKPPQHVLDLVRNAKAKLAEKRNGKFPGKENHVTEQQQSIGALREHHDETGRVFPDPTTFPK